MIKTSTCAQRRGQQFNYILLNMKPNNSSQGDKLIMINTPNTFVFGRGRLLSFNTPQLSPLRMVQSPYLNLGDPSIFDNQLNIPGQFRLQEGGPCQQNVEPVQQSSDESVEQIQFPKFPAENKVTKENMIQFLVDCVNLNEQRIIAVRQQIEEAGPPFLVEVYNYLYKRFKKVKKTKEEMIKYTMRKSFKYITDQLKKQDPSLIPLLTTDGLEGMSIYFRRYSDEDEIFIPFKKNSLEKTMNANFLKKVFSIYRFYRDYKKFLKTFQNEFLKDNRKKIGTMNDAVKQCLTAKNFKSLENFKRLPWTKDILMKLKEFAAELLNYSPFSKEGAPRPIPKQKEEQCERKYSMKMDLPVEHEKPSPKRSIDSMNYDEAYRDLICNEADGEKEEKDLCKKQKKKNVIILTPPIHPINSPKIPDLGLNLE